MKHEIYLKPCPPELLEKAEQERFVLISKHYYNRDVRIIYQGEKESLLYTFIYAYSGDTEGEETLLPDYIIVADMEEKKWDTYSVEEEKWGKKTLGTIGPYYSRDHIVEKRIDRGRYGMTLEEMQNSVNSEKRQRKWEKRDRKTMQDMAKAAELTSGFKKWAERQLMPYLLYKPGENHTAFCTRCKRTSHFKKKLKLYKERQCPHCRSMCRIRTEKTMPGQIARCTVFIQRTDTGIMMRFIHVSQSWQGSVYAPVKFYENLRVVVNKGEKQIWYERRGASNHNDGWERNNYEGWIKNYNSPEYETCYIKGLGTIRQKANQLVCYERNIQDIINHSNLSYIEDWNTLMKRTTEKKDYPYDVYTFLDVYEMLQKYRQIESLWKLGYQGLVYDIIKERGKYPATTSLHKWLGITKEMWRYLCKLPEKEKKNMRLNILKEIREYDNAKEKKDIVWRVANEIPYYHRDTFKDLPLRKLLCYLETEKEQLYADYISLAKQAGYDLSDDFIAFPRDLQAAHDNALLVKEEKENQKELDRAKEHDKGIAKIYKKIKKRFSFESNGYIIRPAASNYEIVKEGQTLHHCVGLGQYRRKMLEEASYIVFLRKKEQPDKPYYTVEIKPDGEILQSYGKGNKKPDWETVGPVLDKYSKKVRKEQCQKVSCRETKITATCAVPMAQ